MKVFRIEDAAERLGLSTKILKILEEEGRIQAQEHVADVSYYSQVALDKLIHDLHCSMQHAAWADMENRMETVERQCEGLQKELKKLKDQASRII